MERICPYLALESDGRTVVAGYDPEHRCGATQARDELERPLQLSTCLDAAHRQCDRFVAAMQSSGAAGRWPQPAPDARILASRLVLAPETARRRLASSAMTARSGRVAIGGTLAVVGVAAVAAGMVGGLGSLANGSPSAASAVASAIPQPTATVVPAIGGTASATPTPLRTDSPAPTTAPTLDATPSPVPQQQRTYVVQAGDTLGAIATRFGTTVGELQRANGLGSSDVIVIGQVLIIP